MKNANRVISLVLGAAVLGACASGPDRPPQREGGRGGGGSSGFEGQAAKPIALLFVGMDASLDRTITGNELIAGIEQEWARLPQDGPIGALEYGQWAEQALGASDALPSFISFDRNLDGSLSKIEFDDRLRAEFSELDKNKDGVLERSELIFRVTRASRGQQGGQGGQGGRGGGGGDQGRRPQR